MAIAQHAVDLAHLIPPFQITEDASSVAILSAYHELMTASHVDT